MSEQDDLAELSELPDLPESLAPTAGTPFARPGPAPQAGGPPPLRVLDTAPRHLSLAAVIVVLGSLLPWIPGRVGPAGSDAADALLTLLAKAVALAAAGLWYQQVLHDHGPKRKGVLGQLAELALVPKKKADAEDKARRRPPKPGAAAARESRFPTGLQVLSLALAITALVIAAGDPRQGKVGSNGTAEVAMLGWAAFTWVHIASYERWGGFNPLFPLMFAGMLFAGALGAIGALTGEAGGATKLFGLFGGAVVAAGGGLALFTIAEAMMQAKKQGDRKKADALEARKAARKPRS